MNEIKEIKKRIKKILPTYHGRLKYKVDCPLLKNCNDSFLIDNFFEWNEQTDFLTGLYNLLRFDFTSIKEIKNHIHKIEQSFIFDKSYYEPNSLYYGEKNNTDSCWDNFIISIVPSAKINKNNLDNYIALSRLKEYELEHPNQVIWLGSVVCNTDKKTFKWLYKNKLGFKPNKEESFLC